MDFFKSSWSEDEYTSDSDNNAGETNEADYPELNNQTLAYQDAMQKLE